MELRETQAVQVLEAQFLEVFGGFGAGGQVDEIEERFFRGGEEGFLIIGEGVRR
jgi:hypothetical protein